MRSPALAAGASEPAISATTQPPSASLTASAIATGGRTFGAVPLIAATLPAAKGAVKLHLAEREFCSGGVGASSGSLLLPSEALRSCGGPLRLRGRSSSGGSI